MYYPENNTNAANEWIEVYFNETINIKYWKISVNGRNDTLYNCSDINSDITLSNETYLLITNNQTNNIVNLNCTSCLKVCTFKNKFGSYGLTNTGARINILNEDNNTLGDFDYTPYTSIHEINKSLQFINNTWIEALPTPGYANFFENQTENRTNQTCIPVYNASCTNWGACLNGMQNRTCFDSTNCSALNSSISNFSIFYQSCTIPTEKNVSVSYPYSVNFGQVFKFNLTLSNFPADLYDVKIDITYPNNDSSIAKILNNGIWQTSDWYVDNAINTLITNTSQFSLNITKEYNGSADIEIKIRKTSSQSIIYNSSGYSINCIYNSSNGNSTEDELYLEIEDIGTINSKNEQEIEVSAYNLEDYDYDLKISILKEDVGTIISEVWNEDENKWQSSNYYLENVFKGDWDKQESFKIRIKSTYKSWDGDGELEVKLRKNGGSSILAEEKIDVRINGESSGSSGSSSSKSTKKTTKVGQEIIVYSAEEENESLINLGKKGVNTIYESKTEKMSNYLLYGIAFFIVLLILIVLVRL